jgi:hypothetical protein
LPRALWSYALPCHTYLNLGNSRVMKSNSVTIETICYVSADFTGSC